MIFLLFQVTSSLVTVPTVPGLEYTLPGGLLHYTLPNNTLDYELPENKLHATLREEDG